MPALAKPKRDVYAGQYGRPGAASNWHFLTGEQARLTPLSAGTAFSMCTIPQPAVAHAAAILVLTRTGASPLLLRSHVSRHGIFSLGLVEASEGKNWDATDHALLYCYQYDPMTGKYGLIVMNVVRARASYLAGSGNLMFVMSP